MCRVPKQSGKALEIANFRLGFNLGLIVAILCLIIYVTTSANEQKIYPRFESVMIVFRMLGVAVLMVWFW